MKVDSELTVNSMISSEEVTTTSSSILERQNAWTEKDLLLLIDPKMRNESSSTYKDILTLRFQ
jgi:hypothetical protein